MVHIDCLPPYIIYYFHITTGENNSLFLITAVNILLTSLLQKTIYSFLFVYRCSQHQELARQLQEQTDPSHPQATAELERQLEHLVEHLETKADQIKIVRKQLQSSKQRPHTKTHPHMTATLPVSRGGEVQVTTTVKAKATTGTPQCEQQHKTPSLEFLKKMKSLQNTLQRDDLSWN